MILSAQSIRHRCLLKPAMIEPFCERDKTGGMSYGLSSCGYDIRIAEHINLEPGGFALGSTIEMFRIPKDVTAVVHDKSSWGRKGLAVQNTVLEPGWEGFLTIELSNHSKLWISIVQGMPIAQLIFHKLDHTTEQPYTGKYQNQEPGPQEARYEY